VLLVRSRQQSLVMLSLDQLNGQVATNYRHLRFQPDSSVSFWLRTPGHLYLRGR